MIEFLALFLSGIPLVIYSIYYFATFVCKVQVHKLKNQGFDFPPISIVVPAYNEEKIIFNKIKNLNEIDYPNESIEIIVVDDASSDRTKEQAIKAFAEFDLNGQVITIENRSGTNYSLNRGIYEARNDVVITTDADVVLEEDALKEIVEVLLADKEIGAVCGELCPVTTKKTMSTSTELPYRSLYGKMCLWESNMHSTYCFNGQLIGLKKHAYSDIDTEKGASDASMALSVIKNGYRALYVPSAKFREYITPSIISQKKQKIRRATRLIACTLSNWRLLFSYKQGKFGMVIFPLRFSMFIIAPASFFASILLWAYILFRYDILLGVFFLITLAAIIVGGRVKPNLFSSFVWHQIYLLIGLFYLFRRTYLWEHIERKGV